MYRRFARPRWVVGHLLVLLAALVCLRLGWWQWERSHQRTGSIQNLGYAVLWPVFGGAFIYMWVRFLALESDLDAADDAEPPGPPMEAIAAPAEPGPAQPDGLAAADRRTTPDLLPRGESGELLGSSAAPGAESRETPAPRSARTTEGRGAPSRAVTVGVGFVGGTTAGSAAAGGGDDGDEEGLAAYNRALAALAEKDRRRAQ